MATRKLLGFLGLILLLELTVAGQNRPILPGLQPDGSVRLPNQWSLRPVGKQVLVGDFPVNLAVHPRGQFVAVLHAGYGKHEVAIIDISRAEVVSRAGVNQAFYGLAFSPDGTRLYCSGAGDEIIHSFLFKDGYLSEHKEIRLRDEKATGVPSGIGLEEDGRAAWVANLWGHSISRVSLSGRPASKEISLTETARVAATGSSSRQDPDLAAATKRQEAALLSEYDLPFPYTCLVDARRHRVYTSLWAQSRVAVHDVKTGRLLAEWAVGEHPNEMLLSQDGKYLYVANANQNTVTVLNAESGKPLETLSAALYPTSPPGSTPNSLAITPDGRILFVANACNNNLAVFDVSEPGKSRSLGFVPVGWYPTSVRVTPDGKHLVVANGKGLVPKANPHGPQPVPGQLPSSLREYIAGLLQGTVGIIPLPSREELLGQLKGYTAEAYRASPLTSELLPIARQSTANPVPGRVGDPSPIKYCIYILKENRTYDQVFGDLERGNGEPNLCLFPEEVTPNHHQLARQFVLLDNFYVESEVSADGHEWSMGAYASDFVEKSWPLNYGHNDKGKFPYPSEGNFPVASPSAGYLWDRAQAADVSYRSYGEFINNGKAPGDPAWTRVPALEGHFDPGFHGWDLDYPDVKRAERFISELHRYEKEGGMPALQIVRLPNDHTSGTRPGKLSPQAMVADNDLALGLLVEAVSKSRFWRETAIFVVEDDAQNGPDHVDAHRTVALVISPYTQHGRLDSSLYSTSSMLRTIELILGLKPMTQFDAAALPMYNSFSTQANLEPYRALTPKADLNERNASRAWGARASLAMDFSKEDAADDILLNEVIWRSIRGAARPMPVPVRAGFVLVHEEEEGEED
jgi:DNA-binding beta-propeller fold protein YncE